MEYFDGLARIYLKSNAMGTMDGYVKGDTHRKLCIAFISDYFSIPEQGVEGIKFNGDKLCLHIRRATLPLTDFLDEEIGFPLDKAPNYHNLVPLFVNKFKGLATQYIKSHVELLTLDGVETVVCIVSEFKFARAFNILDSYGFEFVEGDVDEGVLIMRSIMGHTVHVRNDKYFGCTCTIIGEDSV